MAQEVVSLPESTHQSAQHDDVVKQGGEGGGSSASMQGTGSMISLPPPPPTPPDDDKGAPAQQVSDDNAGKVKRMQAERGKLGTMGAGKEEATRDRFQKQSQLGDYDKGFFRNIGTTIKDSVVDLKDEMTGVTSTKGDMAASYGGLALTGVGAGLKKLDKTVPNKSFAQTLTSVKTESFGELAALSQAAGILGLVAGAINLVVQCFKIKDATKRKDQADLARGKLREASLAVDGRVQEIQTHLQYIAEQQALPMAPAELDTDKRDAEQELETMAQKQAELQDATRTLDSVSFLQNEQRKDAIRGTVGAVMSITGSALALSGFGLPVTIGFAVFGALMAGGSWLLDKARDSKATEYMELSHALNDNGEKVKSPKEAKAELKKDPKLTPDYRKMESRFLNAYYKDVFGNPTGDEELDGAIGYFARQEKKGRLGTPERDKVKKTNSFEGSNVRPQSQVGGRITARQYWQTRTPTAGKASVEDKNLEKDSGGWKDTFRADPTKGTLAKSAAKADVVYALREIAARTLAISPDGKADWDFGLNVARVDPSTVDKDAGEDQMKQLAALTDKAVMDSTNLSGKAQAYWEQRQKIAKTAKLDPTSAEVTAKTEDWVAKFVK
ncbi:MAG: hypothetical protein JNM72_08305 [Deltaproteobacteria bacterium]|jgi:hypothetical protein|nr:hypothetical protein [Deltaproteobacteria bacterium]